MNKQDIITAINDGHTVIFPHLSGRKYATLYGSSVMVSSKQSRGEQSHPSTKSDLEKAVIKDKTVPAP